MAGNPNTDWFKDAKYGIFMHFLPGDEKGFGLVEKFDVEALAGQLELAGAKHFVLTLGQNSGYFNSPNATYDRYTGYAPGERCAKRDLPAELYAALEKKSIKLLLYLPCQTPNQDARAQKAQTAWALLALLHAGEAAHPAVAHGVQFLLSTQRPDGFWDEAEFTGTGFPRVFYLRYHGYGAYFPVWALALYRRSRDQNGVSYDSVVTPLRPPRPPR